MESYKTDGIFKKTQKSDFFSRLRRALNVIMCFYTPCGTLTAGGGNFWAFCILNKHFLMDFANKNHKKITNYVEKPLVFSESENQQNF